METKRKLSRQEILTAHLEWYSGLEASLKRWHISMVILGVVSFYQLL